MRLVLVFAAGLAIGIGAMAVGSVMAQTTPLSPATPSTTSQPTPNTAPGVSTSASPIAAASPVPVTGQTTVSPELEAAPSGMETVPINSVVPPDVPRASDGSSLSAQPFAVQQQFVQVWGLQAWQEWANQHDAQIRGVAAPASTPAPATAPAAVLATASPAASPVASPALPLTTTPPSDLGPGAPLDTGAPVPSEDLVEGTPTPVQTGP